jgi:circadian clock protein KaiB
MKKSNFDNKENNDDAKGAEYVLKLFVSGASPNSVRAIMNLKNICEAYLPGKYKLEIIDVYQQGIVARDAQIIALPLLIKEFPLPERRIIGDMSETKKLLHGLGLDVDLI